MKILLKYSGLILQLIGVALLLIPKMMGKLNNGTLAAGGICIALGIIVYIIISKFEKK